MEAGLLELLFDVDLALLDERQQVAAQPCDLGEGEAVLGDVDGLAGEMGRGGVAVGGSGVAVGAEEMLLELDGADGGVDLERRVEAGVVGAGHGGEKLRGPGAAVAAILREAFVDVQGAAGGDGDKRFWLRRSRMSSSSWMRSRPSRSATSFWWRSISWEPLSGARDDEAGRACCRATGRMTGVAAASSTLSSCGLSVVEARATLTTDAGLATEGLVEADVGVGWGVGWVSSSALVEVATVGLAVSLGSG